MSDVEIVRGGRVSRRRSSRPLPKIVRKKPRKRYRGVPPPLTFDINGLPEDGRLSKTEVAAAFRRSVATVDYWQKHKVQPLDWRFVAGRWNCTVGSVRAVLKGEEEK